ncbi:MAG: TlpA family protein disulfide reductase [Chloroflexi bacterium]|nr:TlpA family protein disulfide reductase [Chloroflexota bacterium]MBM3173021.1 TlpA family protein disulfide reductase [Chloroflexota bacterium]MBM3175302.1 TlpA family protein disulfide reductase [Chloroflexota bacterium]MBM4450158.1 TlpA family protein disulfide reductase [Chloroflexota bacterium]
MNRNRILSALGIWLVFFGVLLLLSPVLATLPAHTNTLNIKWPQISWDHGEKTKEVAAPDFTLQTTNGETITLSKLRGRPVILTFWSINCQACRQQEPYIQAFHDRLTDNTLKLITVNIGDHPVILEQYIASDNITFPVLLDTNRKVARSYGIPGVPVTIFIDVRGYVTAYKIGPFQSREDIEKAVDSIWPLLTKTS